MCLLAVPFFFFHSIHKCCKPVVLYRYKTNVSPCSTVFFFILYIDVLNP